MKKIIFLLIILSASIPTAYAQESYFGITASAIISPVGIIPLPGLQYGGKIDNNLEFRVSFESLIAVSSLSTDILYIEALAENNSRYYLGGGGDILILVIPWISGALPIAIHATAGYEQLYDKTGVFAELQPLITFGGIALKTKAGINFHF